MSETQYPIETKTVPTFYFVGVTTAKSSIMRVFPRWMEAIGRPDVVIEGIDHAIHDDPEAYRRTVAQMKYDPLSLGALVTTHKIDLLEAARDMFDELHSSARLTGEVSSISKRDGKLWGHAKDPLTSGLSLDAITGPGYFGRTGGHVLCFGAGGSGKAMSLHLINKQDPADRPRKMIITNRSAGRLATLRAMVESLETDIEFEFIQNADPGAERHDYGEVAGRQYRYQRDRHGQGYARFAGDGRRACSRRTVLPGRSTIAASWISGTRPWPSKKAAT